MKKLISAIQCMKLRKKLNLITFLAILFVGLCSLATASYAFKQYDTMLYESNSDAMANVVSNLSAKLDTVAILTDTLIANNLIQENLALMMETDDAITYNRSKKAIYDTLNYYLFSNPYVISLDLVMEDQIVHIGMPQPLAQEDIQQYNLQANAFQGKYFWTFHQDLGQVMIIREVRQKAYLSLKRLATLYVTIDFEQLVADTLIETDNNKGHFILLSDNQIITPGDTPFKNDLELLLFPEKSYVVKKLGDKRMFITHGTISDIGCHYVNLIDYNAIFSQIQILKLQNTGIIIIAMAFVLFLINGIANNILSYFDILVRKMKHFENGDFEKLSAEHYDGSRQDELGNLNRAFDEMAEHFNQLIQDNYIKQISLKDAQLRMLQQQINPHFLYNTLDSINWMAQSYGADDISKMVQSLGNLFRGIVNSQEDLTTLSEELKLLQDYLYIQSCRFKERLQYEMMIPPEFPEVKIPKLTLQPLVENAIEHGLEKSFDTCTITMKAETFTDYYQISISNTGSSFAENLLQRIQNQDLVPSGSGVGLLNIDKRLKLIYGVNFGLRFKNETNTAIAKITIPKEVHHHAATADH